MENKKGNVSCRDGRLGGQRRGDKMGNWESQGKGNRKEGCMWRLISTTLVSLQGVRGVAFWFRGAAGGPRDWWLRLTQVIGRWVGFRGKFRKRTVSITP